MKELIHMMDYRQNIRVVDATLRDGGLVNDFYFTDDFVKDLCEANIRAGVDYMELGYKASKRMFDEDKFGKWKFCDEDKIVEVLGESHEGIKFAAMADVGRCDYKTDIVDKKDSPLDLIRVATYIDTIPAAVDMIENAKAKGYEVSCNIMAISNAQESNIRVALDLLGRSPVDVIYIVDSYGHIFPEEMARVAHLFHETADKYGKEIGIHAHNNQQLAFANTIEAIGDDVNWVDATYNGMGRGAGNCAMEQLLGMLRNPKYHQFPVIKFIDKHIRKLKEEGIVWGYDIQYMLTGQMNQHPRSAIAFTKENRQSYSDFYHEAVVLD